MTQFPNVFFRRNTKVKESFRPTFELISFERICKHKVVQMGFPRTFLIRGNDFRPIPYPWCVAKLSLLLKVNFDACDYTGYISHHLIQQLNFTLIAVRESSVQGWLFSELQTTGP